MTLQNNSIHFYWKRKKSFSLSQWDVRQPSDQEVIGKILECERESILEQIIPKLVAHVQAPPKPIWCGTHYKYEDPRANDLCQLRKELTEYMKAEGIS